AAGRPRLRRGRGEHGHDPGDGVAPARLRDRGGGRAPPAESLAMPGGAGPLEPSPQNLWLCRRNLVANGLDDRVRLLPFAASDRAVEMALVIGGGNRGGPRVLSADSDHPAQAGGVRSVTLDSLVADGTIDPDRAGLLWCDAAGHDAYAVLGGSRLVEARVPMIVNVSGAIAGETRDAFVELLTPHYAEIVELRKAKRTLPIDALTDLVAGYQHKGDVL